LSIVVIGMAVNLLKYLAIGAIVSLFLVWATLHDNISCVIDNADVADVNGYYSAYGAVYVSTSHNEDITVYPDFFDIYRVTSKEGNFKNAVIIAREKTGWGIYELPQTKVYGNTDTSIGEHTQSEAMHPPPTGWMRSVDGILSSDEELEVHSCRGSHYPYPTRTTKEQYTNHAQSSSHNSAMYHPSCSCLLYVGVAHRSVSGFIQLRVSGSQRRILAYYHSLLLSLRYHAYRL
jgi:hypothetical protein